MNQHTTTHTLALLAGILLSALAASPARGEAEQAATVLALADVGLPSASSMAVGPGGRRVYVGRESSYDPRRRNLAVVSLDAQGRRVGGARRYADSTAPLAPGTHVTVTALLTHPGGRKLYVASNHAAKAGASDVTRVLSVYDLDAAGEPAGAPRGYESGNPQNQVMALALHPRADRLYMVGWGSPAVHVYELDAAGEPQGQPKTYPVGANGKFSVAVSPGGERLYLGTYPNTLEIVDLDAKGAPTAKVQSFPAGAEQVYLQFAYTPRALYLKGAPGKSGPLAVWPLADGGAPAGLPKLHADVVAGVVAADPAYERVWLAKDLTFPDAFTDKPVVDGVAAVSFKPGDDPARAASATPESFRQAPVAMAVGAGGRAVLLTRPIAPGFLGNRVKGYRMRVTVLEAQLRSSKTPATVPLEVHFGLNNRKVAKLGDVKPGEGSQWLDLDPYLRDKQEVPIPWPMPAVIYAQPPHYSWWPDSSLGKLKLRIEVAHGETTLKTLEEAVTGANIVVLLPHYGYEPQYGLQPPDQRPPAQSFSDAIETLSDHAGRYLGEARKHGLGAEERPKLYVINANNLIGAQAHLGQLKRQAEAVALLGFNTANVYGWEGIPLKQIDDAFDSFGLRRRSMATYNPPSYFAWDQEKMNEAALAKWAAEQAKLVKDQNGGTPADLVDFVLSDEPGWYYPTITQDLRKNPKHLEAFRAYLKSKGLKPQDVGQASWDTVYPVGASEATAAGAPVTVRRLYYWTMRFFPESASQGHRLARLALEKAFGHSMFTPVNWNNFSSRWYIASPNEKIFNNPVSDPDSAFGSMDWFTSGRTGAHTLWTEDWFADQEAQQWSVHADMLRSAAMLGDQEFGGYVIGAMTGDHPHGVSYKVLSLLGHGGKEMAAWAFGPAIVAGGNGWSENLFMYRPMAEALRTVAKAERLMHPGRPVRGKVALFLPNTSGLWDADRRNPYYQHEMFSLHHALTHAGYTVDYVDDEDLEQGQLAKRAYSALYLTGPNVSVKGQQAVANWVRGGGTVAVMPGAAVLDELNTPTPVFDELLGLTSRTAVRDAMEGDAETDRSAETLVLSGQLGKGNMPLHGPVAKLQPAGATTLAPLGSGGPGITSRTHGKGRALAYAFFPGRQYFITPDRSDKKRLPQGWGEAQRKVAVEPARLAKTPRPVVVGTAGVEACLLESPQGMAVVLLNWTDEPIDNLAVNVADVKAFRKVSSVEQGALRGTFTEGRMKLTLPLRHTDVLLIE